MTTSVNHLPLNQQQQLAHMHAFMLHLTPMERQVVRLAVTGLDDHEIAQHAICSVYTIRRHIENITKKSQDFYGYKLAFRRQIIPRLAPYVFLQLV